MTSPYSRKSFFSAIYDESDNSDSSSLSHAANGLEDARCDEDDSQNNLKANRAQIDSIIDRMLRTKKTCLNLLELTDPSERPEYVLKEFHETIRNFKFLTILPTEDGSSFCVALTTKILRCKFYPHCNQNCNYIHVCKHYMTSLAGSCRKGRHCQFDHDLVSAYNKGVLAFHGLNKIKVTTLKKILLLVDPESGFLLRMCENNLCKAKCGKLHSCFFFVRNGNCRHGSACLFGHRIKCAQNNSLLFRRGFANIPESALIDYLRDLHGEQISDRFGYGARVGLLRAFAFPVSSTASETLNEQPNRRKQPKISPKKCGIALLSMDEIPTTLALLGVSYDSSPLVMNAVKTEFYQSMESAKYSIKQIRRICSKKLLDEFDSNGIDEFWGFYALRWRQLILPIAMNGIARTVHKYSQLNEPKIYFRASDAHKYTNVDPANNLRTLLLVRFRAASAAEWTTDNLQIDVPRNFYPEFVISYSEKSAV